MANSTGKKSRNTGTIMVPNPNPEKKVSSEANKAIMGIRYSKIGIAGNWR